MGMDIDQAGNEQASLRVQDISGCFVCRTACDMSPHIQDLLIKFNTAVCETVSCEYLRVYDLHKDNPPACRPSGSSETNH